MNIVTGDYLADFSTAAGTGFLKRRDADGTVWLYGTYTAAGVDKTPMQVIMVATGYSFIAAADGTDYMFVGLPDGAHAITTKGWIQVGGYTASMVVESLVYEAGDAIKMYDGTIVTTSAAYDGNAAEFAVVITTQTAAAVTTDAMLNPEQILETT